MSKPPREGAPSTRERADEVPVRVRRRRRRTLAAAGAALAFAAAAALVLAPGAGENMPSFDAVRARAVGSDALLLDRHGAPLHERRVDTRTRRLDWTPLAEISPALVGAVIASEDRRFGWHPGVDPVAIAAALRDAALGRGVRGASTLAMQLAKRLGPDGGMRSGAAPRGVKAKLRQAWRALLLAQRWSDAEILEAYLNLVTFRGELAGVDAASRGLFGKAPHGLDDAEAAVLAALLPAPGAAPEAVAERACRVARRAPGRDRDGACAEAEARARIALAGPPRVRPRVALAPHLATRLLARGTEGRRLPTTLDASLQAFVDGVLRRQVLAVADRNVRDAAALVVENATGDVVAYVGSTGALSRAPEVDGVRARRQAGSTLKPFLYAAAFEERRITPLSLLDDGPLDVPTLSGVYRPENYDRSFRGPVPARHALASSLNVPAVRVLGLVGVDGLVARLEGAGVAGLRDADFYGASLALGSADVTLWELVAAYRTLARGGVHGPLRLRPGDPATPEHRVFSAEAAFLVADALSDRASRAPTFGLESALATSSWSAVKTGTSKDMRDNWCLGFSSRYTIGVWVGNASGAPMWDVSGVDGAAPAWLEIWEHLHRDAPSQAPATPPGVVRARGEWVLAGTEPVALPASAGRERAAESAALARIASPSDRTILVLDPDVPAGRERVLLDATPRSASLRWRLGDEDLGSADEPRLWAPRRGRHELSLVDAGGEVRDRVSIRVR